MKWRVWKKRNLPKPAVGDDSLIAHLEKMGDKLYYKVSELATMYGLDAPTLNQMLCKAGLQKQVNHSKYNKTYFRTSAGIDYAKRENRDTYAILLWLEDVMKLLEMPA